VHGHVSGGATGGRVAASDSSRGQPALGLYAEGEFVVVDGWMDRWMG
jgi:hypothetical protein